MKLVNGAKFLSITFLFLLFGAAVAPVFGTVIVTLTCMHKLHKNLTSSLKFQI